MNWFRRNLTFLCQLKSNEIDHGDILALQIIPFMRNTATWWTVEDNPIVSCWRKVFYYFCIVFSITVFPCSIFYFALHKDEKPLAYILQDIAFCLSGIAGISAPLSFQLNRKSVAKLLKVINEKNKEVLRIESNQLENRRRSNQLFLFLYRVFVGATIVGILIPLKFFLEFLSTGEEYFKNYFFPSTPFSLMAFVNSGVENLVIEWMGFACTGIMIIVAEVLLRISSYFLLTAQEISKLRKGDSFSEVEEMRKLKELYTDYLFLQWCVRELIRITRFYIIAFVSVIFATMGIYISLMIWVVTVNEWLIFMALPIYHLLFLTVFCAIGQHLTNSTAKVRLAAYNCNWCGAPMEFKTIILNLLTQTMTETTFQASSLPFYKLNCLLLTTFVKKVYTFIAIVKRSI